MTEIAALTANTTAPTPAQEATEQLNALTQDKAWGAKLLAGDVATTRQYNALVEKSASAEDRIQAAIDGKSSPLMFETTDDERPMSSRDLATAVSWMRDDGLSDKTIKRALTDGAIPAEEQRQAKITLSNLMGNKEWAAKLFAGDVSTRRDFVLLSLQANSRVG